MMVYVRAPIVSRLRVQVMRIDPPHRIFTSIRNIYDLPPTEQVSLDFFFLFHDEVFAIYKSLLVVICNEILFFSSTTSIKKLARVMNNFITVFILVKAVKCKALPRQVQTCFLIRLMILYSRIALDRISQCCIAGFKLPYPRKKYVSLQGVQMCHVVGSTYLKRRWIS